jgi:pyrroline-5-carboxylate reductase
MKKVNEAKVVFLGAGNMAEALVRGLLAGKVCPAEHESVTDLRPERRDYFNATFGVAGQASNVAAATLASASIVRWRSCSAPSRRRKLA